MLAFNTRDFPRQLEDFASFLGRHNLSNRVERIDRKFDGLRLYSDVFQRRYAFPFAFCALYHAILTNKTLNFSDPCACRAASTIAAINAIKGELSDSARMSFRSHLLDALSPDRDFRQIEHETRAYVHFMQRGFSVRFADLEGFGRYDLLLTDQNGRQFEAECKTISEDTGGFLTAEESMVFFEAFAEVLPDVRVSSNFGIVTWAVRPSFKPEKKEVLTSLKRYIAQGLVGRHEDEVGILSFEEREGWGKLLAERNLVQLRNEMLALHEAENPHCMLLFNDESALLLSLTGERPGKLAASVRRVVSSASKQLSGYRPGLIWLHFLGLPERALKLLSQEAKETGGTAFSSLAHHAFRSDTRLHVKKLWFSADGMTVRETRLPGGGRAFHIDGPVYATTSLRCRFDEDFDAVTSLVAA